MNPRKDKSSFQSAYEEGFKRGGVFVYGMESARANVRKDKDWVGGVPEAFQKDKVSGVTKGYTTVDVVNNETWRGATVEGKGMFQSGVSPDKIPGAMESHRERAMSSGKRGSTQRTTAKKFHDGILAHKTYDPRSTAKADAESVKQKEHRELPDAAKFRSQTIKACKFGIDYAAENQRTVLFLLDGLDDASTVGKEPIVKHNNEEQRKFAARRKGIGEDNWKQIPETQQQRSITGAELRKAFRRDVSDEGLQFFKGHERVPAPWVQKDSYAKWHGYLEHRLNRYQTWAKSRPDVTKWDGAKDFLSLKIPTKQLDRQGFRDINQRINAAKSEVRDTADEATCKVIDRLGRSHGQDLYLRCRG